MKVFVTGAAGFVGTALVNLLLERGHTVRALVHKKEIPASWDRRGVEKVQGDIKEAESLKGKLNGCDAVIHNAGIILESGTNTFERVHYEGSRNVVNAALEAGITRFVHMSSLGARSQAPRRYNITKAMGEEVVTNAPVIQTIFRPSVIFGPGDHQSMPFINLIRFSPVVPVIKSPYGKIQPISVKEVAQCFVAALEDVKTHYQTYDLGGPQIFTWPELVHEYARVLGKKRKFVPVSADLLIAPSKLVGQVPGLPISQDQLMTLKEDLTCDTKKSLETFGVPQQTLEQILREILQERKAA